MINAMLNHARAPRTATCRPCASCLSAGEALPPELYRRWKETFGVEILDGIGSAEMFHIYISNYPGRRRARAAWAGWCRATTRASWTRTGGTSPRRSGHVWIKGESAAILYWQAHEKSKEVLRGDWVVTGDHMRRDEEGYFWYEGRTDEMLKVGGIFVSPTRWRTACCSTRAWRNAP